MEILVWAARSMGMEIIFKKEEKCYIWRGEDDSLSSVQRQFKVLVGYFNNCTIYCTKYTMYCTKYTIQNVGQELKNYLGYILVIHNDMIR